MPALTPASSSLRVQPFRAAQAGRQLSVTCRADAASSRREVLASTAGLLAMTAMTRPALADTAAATRPDLNSFEPMDALKGKDYGKPRMKVGDYEVSPLGVQYKDFREGSGDAPKSGDLCVVDWAGVTIGYYGRPFEARNKPKGGSFTGENKEFLRFKLGQGALIPAFEEAVAGMKPGGIRRIIVPVELGYPDNDWHKQGPAPTTFAGQRALEFVLSNKGMIDKTLLFDIELVRVDRS